jgi:mRNA-degrading endonuclease RelE of RelBE toxin-antitoxin system
VAFDVLLHPKVAKALGRIEKQTRQRIKEQLRELRERPEKAGKQLKYSNFWSLRIGYYRAVYEISREIGQVIVLFIGHRKKVYDDFSKMF